MSPRPPIVPPRPNLGPEPWPSPEPWPWFVGLGAVAGFVVFLIRRRGRRAKAVEASPTVEAGGTAAIEPEPESADRVRSALVRAFGPGWRARTTEEVAASADLTARFGEEAAARVVDYLRAIDRAKFSGDPDGPDDELGGWAARFADEVKPRGDAPSEANPGVEAK